MPANESAIAHGAAPWFVEFLYEDVIKLVSIKINIFSISIKIRENVRSPMGKNIQDLGLWIILFFASEKIRIYRPS